MICFQSKASRLETPEELMFHFRSKGRKKRMTQRNQSGRRSSPLLTDSQESQSFCFTPAFDGLDETHPHLLSSIY